MKSKKVWIVNCSIITIIFFIFVQNFLKNNHGKLQEYLLISDPSDPVQFRFSPWRATQGYSQGDLPFHFYLYPDEKNGNSFDNPGIVTYRDFIIWAGLDFPSSKYHLSDYIITCPDNTSFRFIPVDAMKTFSETTPNKEHEEKGFKYVKKKAKRGHRYYQTILAGYYFYFDNIRKGLYWAEKSAEAGETGSMNILGEAYTHGCGVIQDDIEGLKWYLIASSLGDRAAHEELLARSSLFQESTENRKELKQAQERAKEWMLQHKKIFIYNP
ncbi:MAG: tetratricopeptide repeat protein [Candidatus Rhabdochlamydia sp.]